MEGATNGGMLYHEVQESKLCAVHCVNTVLQGPFFSEFDLAAIATDLDAKERQMMFEANLFPAGEESHNVSLDGNFSIQVLEKALEVWDLKVIPLNCPVAQPAQVDPALENAFICHQHNHWFCVRKVNGEWYNFDSLYSAPEHFSKFYLSVYLDSLKGSGWSIFIVRGNFPKEFPMSPSEAVNGYGHWLTPEEAKRIRKPSNFIQAPPATTQQHPIPVAFSQGRTPPATTQQHPIPVAFSLGRTPPATTQQHPIPVPFSLGRTPPATTQQHPIPVAFSLGRTDMQIVSDMEDEDSESESDTEDEDSDMEDDEDLKAAIAASLMDSFPAAASAETSNPKTENEDSKEKTA